MPDSDRRNTLLITDNQTGEPCYSFVENGTVSKMDFRQIKKPDNSHKVSSADEDQALLEKLDRFSGALVAELLAGGPVAIDGLGTFSVVHEHAIREATEAGFRFVPPRKLVRFDFLPSGKGDSARIASERLDMKADEARQLATSFAGLFERSRKQSLELNLRGLGSFSTVEGRYGFQPEPSLMEVLNSAYEGLKTIDMPERKEDVPGSVAKSEDNAKTEGNAKNRGEAKRSGSFKKSAVVVMASLLLGGGYFVVTQHSLESIISMTGRKTRSPVISAPVIPTPVTSSPARVSSPGALAPKAGSAEPDSVMLAKGRFTVVTATFSSMKSVRQEIQRLSGLGHRVRVWPVKSAGRESYRLVIGDFASHRLALDSIKTMPPGLSKNIYIQQVAKNLFLYGENGL
jgi:nucleoid DNA-binding protein